ncbi:MAG: hypothetical protein HRU75_02855 [Planctomycetia bacterium]|nr:MAG: hypothetical protein HRU75_02855 [Planctomycetia bacterium]
MNLKSYEGQARLSVILAIVGACAALGAAFFMLSALDASNLEINLRAGGRRFLGIMAGIGVGFLAGVIGFFMGLSGAGEKRNKASSLSWMGFFLSAGVLAAVLCLGVFFFFTKNFVG